MKTFILALVLLVASTAVYAQSVYEERTSNNRGQLAIRIINNVGYPVSCYYQDQANYYTFSLYPGYTSSWFLVYGQYSWGCE